MEPIIKIPVEDHTETVYKFRSNSDYTVLNILKILLPLRRSPLRYTDLARVSEIRMKERLFKYMNFCINRGLMKKKDGVYYITDGGESFIVSLSETSHTTYRFSQMRDESCSRPDIIHSHN